MLNTGGDESMIGEMDPARLLEIFSHHQKGKRFKFTTEIAKVILGSCSMGMANLCYPDIGHSTIDINEPFGHTTRMNLKFFRHYLENTQGNVLIVTECCGQYDKKQLQELQDAFPEINWIAPRIPDFFDNFQWPQLLEPLLQAGLLQPEA